MSEDQAAPLSGEDVTTTGALATVVRFAEEHSDMFWVLTVEHAGECIAEEADYMEPEDAIFVRDLKWIEPLLHQVYKLGVSDGLAQRDA